LKEYLRIANESLLLSSLELTAKIPCESKIIARNFKGFKNPKMTARKTKGNDKNPKSGNLLQNFKNE